MRTTEEHAAINRMLMSHGLGRLEDGAGLMSQLGYMVQDHEHLRSLLVRCEPENRSSMYDSLKPYLRFTPKALDVYIAESAERAANQDLPTIDSTGNINFSPSPTYEMTGHETGVVHRRHEVRRNRERPAGRLGVLRDGRPAPGDLPGLPSRQGGELIIFLGPHL
jgi:hypothetical protein